MYFLQNLIQCLNYFYLLSLKEIDPDQSTWAMASVGRMTLTLKKKTGSVKWTRLTKSRKKPSNIHFWYELHEKHSDDLDKLKTSDEEDEDDADADKAPLSNSTANATDHNAGEGETEGSTVPKPSPSGKKYKKKEKKAPSTPEDIEFEAEKGRISKELKDRLAAIEEEAKLKKKELEDKHTEAKKQLEVDLEALRSSARGGHDTALQQAEARRASLAAIDKEL
jgi:hypothetical protein